MEPTGAISLDIAVDEHKVEEGHTGVTEVEGVFDHQREKGQAKLYPH